MAAVAVLPFASVSVNVYEAEAAEEVGVPVIAPVDAVSESPEGSAGETDHAYDGAPPLPFSVWLYALPTYASGSVLVTTTGTVRPTTVKLFVVVVLFASFAVMSNVAEPVPVGVPE